MAKLAQYLNYVRLAAFPIGYGITGALVGGMLNRVMIAEMDLSAALVGVFLAAPQLISPLRVWLGYRSDGFTLFGKRREPYIMLGAIIGSLGLLAAVMMVIPGAAGSTALLIGTLVAFVIYGVGRNLGHNTFQALLADKFSKQQRARAMTYYEVTTLVGSVVGAGGLGSALRDYNPQRLVSVVLVVMVVVVLLSIIAAIRQEPQTPVSREATEKARQIPFKQVLRDVVLADRQVRLFFVIVMFTFIGTLAQDILLEPYGALVLNMSVGATTRLTAFWGIGVILSLLLAGTFLVSRLGYRRVLRIGLLMSMLVFTGIILVGATTELLSSVAVFNVLTFVMGLGTGLAGAGMLAGIITFTTPIRAGMLMGVWGMANLLGRASGTLLGGVIVTAMQSLTGNPFIAYATVFGLEVGLLTAAFILSFRLDPETSRARAEERKELQPDASV